MTTVNIAGSCANLNTQTFILHCDLGENLIAIRTYHQTTYDRWEIIHVLPSSNLLALRESVFSNKCNPALLADALEEEEEHWTHIDRPQEILNALRSCWSEPIELSR